MLIPDPAQATAVLEWLASGLNTDDLGGAITPAPFTLGESCYLGDRDHARLARFARIATVSLTGYGLRRHYQATDVGLATQALAEHRQEDIEWATSITVASRLDDMAPALSDSASVHLRRALGRRRGVSTAELGLQGVSFLRGTDVQDTSRIVGGTAWETRATATLVWLCGWRAQEPVEWVDRVQGSGYVPDIEPDLLVWRPLMRSLWDPVTRQRGVNDGTTYDAVEDARIFTPSSDDIQWTDVHDWNGNPTTLAFWAYFDDMVERRPFLAQSPTGGVGLFINTFATRNLRIRHENDGGGATFIITSPNVIQTDRWHHLAFQYDGSNAAGGMSILVDGQPVAVASSASGTGTPRTARDWGFGYSLLASVSHLGRIRDPRAWRALLTQDQIQQVMRRSPLPFDTGEP